MKPFSDIAGLALPALAPLSLEPDEIDVWSANLDGPPPETFQLLESLLSADEQARARRFYFERERRRFVVARGVLRLLLARYTRRAPAAIALCYGPHGKPRLADDTGGGHAGIHFNVAHSEGLGLYAFSRAGEVGIDVERIRDMPDWESIAAITFAPRQLEQLRACPPEKRRDEFFRLWTRQEAILKALGTGLGDPGNASGDNPREAGMHVQCLQTRPGFAAALAASGSGRAAPRLRPWDEAAATAPAADRIRPAVPKGHRRSNHRA